MNNKALIAFSMLLWLALSGCAVAERNWQRGDITVRVVADRGDVLPTYPVDSRGRTRKAYLQARGGERYSVEVTNNTQDRIGLVVAVDGRNIISGRYSKLRANERMYILNPHQSGVYRGWRSARDNVNRFYFTDAGDSYAAAFGDDSAMGVIAVAAYREKYSSPQYTNKNRAAQKSQGKKEKRAGTGYGESEYSPSRRVEFRPRRDAFATHLLKYEWREQLCKRGIIACYQDRPRGSDNRLWREESDYAPPPRRDYWDWR